ncbi:UxaA family hydrolase [Anaerotruncus rubiinfantis]|uniref:UxaA family hydrolase n=1 Tax=Anaerotruncus rubiinfantis TaxID=1720200 RepID=UPI00082AC797|nr:UxaA family hydrolase [Anaerotruncus rubiinfantis]
MDNFVCQGYLRPDDSKGIRNRLLVLYTVDCASFVAQRVAEHFRSLGEQVDLVGARICYDNQTMIDRLLAFTAHPNVGAVLVVGMGCEFTQAKRIYAFALDTGRPAAYFLVQEQGGTRKGIRYGIAAAARLIDEMRSNEERVDFYLSDLTVGLECGGSDFTSGLTANTVLGNLADRIVSAGGTAVFEEPGEMLGLRDCLVGRAATPAAAQEIGALYEKILAYGKASGMYHISPGNFQGGLSTIEEKSIGSVAKSGTAPIQGVLKIAQRPPHPGLWILDRLQDWNMSFGATVAADAGALMELATLGCQVCFLSTGRGHVIGTPVAPTIKLTGNQETYARMEDDLDFDASGLLGGEKSKTGLTQELYLYLQKICAGAPVKAEILGHCEYEMLPTFQRACGKAASCTR